MTEIMTASVQSMTDGQIDNAVAKLRDALRKHRSDFSLDAAQSVLGVENLGMELLAPFRKRAEAVSVMIVRHVPVNRTRTPQEVLDATGRRQYVDNDVVRAMPKGEGDEEEVFFFKPDLTTRDGHISDADLDKEYELRDLKPADPYSHAAVNEVDPAFADERSNGTHWKNMQGKWCFAAFDRWGVERSVRVRRDGDGWGDCWWFAGVRK